MENASKALIIAGAILLSILIIALGVFIFNQAKAAINTDTLSSTEVDTFNSQFDNYMGSNVLGSNVKSLISAINSNGATNKDTMEKLPSVYYFKNGAGSTVTNNAIGGYSSTLASYNNATRTGTFTIGSARTDFSISNYQTELSIIKNVIADSHNYKVSIVGYNETGYIAGIAIAY